MHRPSTGIQHLRTLKTQVLVNRNHVITVTNTIDKNMLLALLAEECRTDDWVTVVQNTERGTSTLSNPWPFGEDIAADLTRPVPDLLPTSDFHIHMYNNRSVGKLATVKEVGPPPWRFPRARLRLRRSGFAVTVGWRYTAYSLMYWLPK